MTADAHRQRHQVSVTRDVRIPTADPQVTLAADLYRPVGTAAVPALVTIFPYRKDRADGLGEDLRWFAERGYACLLADLRGYGSSDGAPRPLFDPAEADDGVAVVEWAAAQAWCTGAVGMWGGSYAAVTALGTAQRHPEHLKAILAIEGTDDPELDSIHPHHARSDLNAHAVFGAGMLLGQLLPPLRNHTGVHEQRRWQRRRDRTEPVLVDLARHGPGHVVWRQRAIDVSSIAVPALCVGGWRDLFAAAMPRIYQQLRGPKQLVMGPWGHAAPQQAAVAPMDLNTVALHWWDYWLRGVDNQAMDGPPVTVYVQGHRPGWRAFSAWPPAADGLAPADGLALATGAELSTLEPATDAPSPSATVVQHQPDATTGALSGLWGTVWDGSTAALDQHDDDMRSLVATGAPLEDDLLICGRPVAQISLAPTAAPVTPAPRLVVRLAEVDPLGRSRFITAGVAHPDVAGTPHTVELWPTAYRIPAGHRIRVVLSDSDFPRLTPVDDPPPLSVTQLAVDLSTLPEAAGSAATVPTPHGSGAGSLPTPTPHRATASGLRWTLTRDHVNDGVEVVIESVDPGMAIGDGHLVSGESQVRAWVRRHLPGSATTTARQAATVRMSTGETVAVTVAVRCTLASVWASGEITIDGEPWFYRTWQADLPDPGVQDPSSPEHARTTAHRTESP